MELVAATINTMLTGATPTDDGRAPSNSLTAVKGVGDPQHFLVGGQGALPQDSNGRPWNGDYVFSSSESAGLPDEPTGVVANEVALSR